MLWRTSALVGCMACAGLACARSAHPADAAGEAGLMVLGASSLKEVLEDLAHAFEAAHPGTKVYLSLAGSQKLRAQLEQGAAADVFVSADEPNMQRLQRAGLVEHPVLVARNRPVLVVSPASAVHGFAELPHAQRLAIGAAEVPIGAYTQGILRAAEQRYGAEFRAAVDARIVSRELSVRQVLTRVLLGEADAGIVYASDAATAGDQVRVLAIPPDLNATARYPAAVVGRTRRPDLARAFLALLVSPQGQARFGAAGFLPAQEAEAP